MSLEAAPLPTWLRWRNWRSWPWRLLPVLLLAVAVSLPMGAISVTKAVLLASAVIWLVIDMLGRRQFLAYRVPHWTSLAVLVSLGVGALSLLWSTAALGEGAHAWVKHAKLLLIPLLLVMIRTAGEARLAVMCLMAAQTFVVICSWLKFAGLPIPFATQGQTSGYFIVFTSHLDQPIMTAILAALAWHLRALVATPRARLALAVLAGLAMANVLFVQFGRTGHLVGLAVLTLALIWQVPMRFKRLALLAPVLVVAAVLLLSPQIKPRLALAYAEITNYQKVEDINSSSGERLNYWRRSLQAFAERPLVGYGVGSWNMQYNRMEGGKGRLHTFQIRNPHQEFLLWMVELGSIGLALLLGLVAAVWRDSAGMGQAHRRATRSVLAAVVVSCLFNAALFDAQIGDFLCVALGLCLALGLRTARLGDGG